MTSFRIYGILTTDLGTSKIVMVGPRLTVRFFPICFCMLMHVVRWWCGVATTSPAYMHMDTLVICVHWIYHICVLAACLRCVEYKDARVLSWVICCIISIYSSSVTEWQDSSRPGTQICYCYSRCVRACMNLVNTGSEDTVQFWLYDAPAGGDDEVRTFVHPPTWRRHEAPMETQMLTCKNVLIGVGSNVQARDQNA
jgi:hypothetical protein